MDLPVDLTRGQYNLTSCNEQLRQLASAKKSLSPNKEDWEIWHQ